MKVVFLITKKREGGCMVEGLRVEGQGAWHSHRVA